MIPVDTRFDGIERRQGEVLSKETHKLLDSIDSRISGPINKWAVFTCGELFRLLTARLVDSDLAFISRPEHLSNEEGCGAEIIRGFIGHHELSDQGAEFRRHVEDEVQHCKSYAEMATRFAAARGMRPPSFQSTDPVEDLGIDYSKEIHLLVLLIHVGELRNLMNMDLMIPALLGSAQDSRQDIGRAMLDIRSDEIGHIRYLSKLVVKFLGEGLLTASDVCWVVGEYDQYWWADVSRCGANLAEARRMETGLIA